MWHARNARKRIFLSTEDEVSLAAKAKYVADKGIGGVMICELAGDYALDPVQNQYYMGTTLIDALNAGIRGATTTTIPGGSTLEFGYGPSAPGGMTDQSGFGLRVTAKGHTGANTGGLHGDYAAVAAVRSHHPKRSLAL